MKRLFLIPAGGVSALLLAAIAVSPARSATPADLLQQWRTEAGAVPFSAARGRQLFESRVTDWSCSTCHTSDPRAGGRHTVTGKPIEPLAPAANPARFTDEAKVAKWMRRNCKDVLQRECTSLEKGDVLTWLLTLKPGVQP
jgi:mono/diheme cytochrome c family protein